MHARNCINLLSFPHTPPPQEIRRLSRIKILYSHFKKKNSFHFIHLLFHWCSVFGWGEELGYGYTSRGRGHTSWLSGRCAVFLHHAHAAPEDVILYGASSPPRSIAPSPPPNIFNKMCIFENICKLRVE
jgi:hypothetical protein